MDAVGDGIAPRFMYVRTLCVSAQIDKLHVTKTRSGTYTYVPRSSPPNFISIPKGPQISSCGQRSPRHASIGRYARVFTLKFPLFLINEHVRDRQRTVRASLLGPCTCRYMYVGCFTQVQSCLRSVVLRVA